LRACPQYRRDRLHDASNLTAACSIWNLFWR